MNCYSRISLSATLLLAAAIGTAQNAPKKPVPPETDKDSHGYYAEFPPALAEAGKLSKDLFIDFGGSDWCGPCKSLKEKILTKGEFIEKASKEFVLVDIDDLKRGGISPERSARYKELQKQYNVGSFPSVILTTPDGSAYAWTTYSPKIDTPEKFWNSLQPLIKRGRAFRESLANAAMLKGSAKAKALVSGMSQIRPDLLWRFHAKKIAELRKLDQNDHTGFLAYLNAEKAVSDMEGKLGQSYTYNKSITVADIEGLQNTHKLKGELLQRAEIMKALILTMSAHPYEALQSFNRCVAAQESLGKYDRGDYVPMNAEAVQTLRNRVDAGLANRGDRVAQYFALHRIFEFELPDRFELSCGYTAFRPNWPVREPISEAYAKALIESTASLSGEARAKALAKGLENTQLLRSSSLNVIISKLIPELAGSESKSLLPTGYRRW